MPPIEILTSNQLDQILTQPVVIIFKYSSNCTTSKNKEQEIRNSTFKFPIYAVNVITNKTLSTEISTRLNTAHQTPQILIVQNGKVIYQVSHAGIMPVMINQFLQNFSN